MLYAGYDIGGTKCAVSLGRVENGALEVLAKSKFPTEGSPDKVIDGLAAALFALLSEQRLSPRDVRAAGVSCGGPLDSRRGLVLSPPNLPGWDEIPVVRLLEEKTGIPTRLQNDANACAVAEWKFGAGRGTRDMAFLTFGTGMGGGLIIDCRLYSGTNDLAGEVGHVRLAEDGPEAYGKKGSFEGFCSGTGIALIAKRILYEKFSLGQPVTFCPDIADVDRITAKDVAEAAWAGDKTAIKIFEISGEYHGKGLAVLIDVLNPEMIVIGSIYARCRQFIEPACMMDSRREALEAAGAVCQIVPAGLGDQVGDYASLSVAIVGNEKD